MPVALGFFGVLRGSNFRVISIDANPGFNRTDRIRTSVFGVLTLRLQAVPPFGTEVFPVGRSFFRENFIQSFGHSFVGYSQSHKAVPFFCFPYN